MSWVRCGAESSTFFECEPLKLLFQGLQPAPDVGQGVFVGRHLVGSVAQDEAGLGTERFSLPGLVTRSISSTVWSEVQKWLESSHQGESEPTGRYFLACALGLGVKLDWKLLLPVWGLSSSDNSIDSAWWGLLLIRAVTNALSWASLSSST